MLITLLYSILLFNIKIYQDLQLLIYKVLRFLFIKIPHFFAKKILTNPTKNAELRTLVYKAYFSTGGDFICYLLIPSIVPPIKILLLQIFVNTILIRIPFLVPHGISLTAFGILIFPTQTKNLKIYILFWVHRQEHLPACTVPTFCLLISRF